MRPARVPARAVLTDEMVARFPLPTKGHAAYRVQDGAEPRLWVNVTPRSRIYLVRKEKGGRSMDVRIGRAPMTRIADARLGAAGVLHAITTDADYRRPPKA